MKNKILILSVLLTVTAGLTPVYALPDGDPVNGTAAVSERCLANRDGMRKQFEQRLNLSEKQKEQAKAIHNRGREEMKPIITQISAKRSEIETVKLSRIAPKMQQEKIDALNAEIATLEKQAREIRKRNSAEFEKILNKKQKAELELMKAEGRARFERYHKARPPFQGLGTPNFLLKPAGQ